MCVAMATFVFAAVQQLAVIITSSVIENVIAHGLPR